MDTEEAMRAARRVITALKGRKGFDWWWADIDPADRRDITRELAEAIPGRKPKARRPELPTGAEVDVARVAIEFHSMASATACRCGYQPGDFADGVRHTLTESLTAAYAERERAAR